MNYKLENFEIVVAEGNRIAGQETGNEYLRCSAVNPFNRFEPAHKVVIFDENTVNHYKQILPQSRGGLKPNVEGWTEDAIPQADKIFVNAMTYEYDLGGEYCRKYTADIIDADGVVIPGKAKGDYICGANGRIKTFRKISVFVQYDFERETIYDDSGFPVINEQNGMPKMRIARNADGTPKQYWVQNWSPSYVGERMRALLVPYDEAAAQFDLQNASVQAAPAPSSASSVFNDDEEAAEAATEATPANAAA